MFGRAFALVLAAAVVPAILFLSFPTSIITDNAHEIAFNRRALYAAWGLFLLVSTLFGALSLWKPTVLVVLTAWAVNLVVWNGLFPHVWLNSPAQIAIACILELGLIALTIIVLSRISISTIVGVGAIFTVLTIMTTIPGHYHLLMTLPGQQDQRPYTWEDRPAMVSSVADRVGGNVYHIVMDMFTTQYLTHRINGDIPANLQGFTFYPRATSNYGRTNFSMRSVFTSDFHPIPLTDWESAFSEGMVARMRDNGVPMYFFPFYSSYCDPSVIVCRSTVDRYFNDRKHIGIQFTIDVSVQRALPLSFRDYTLGSLRHTQRQTDTWDYGFSITNWLIGVTNQNRVSASRRTVQAFTMDTLQDFIEMEPTLPPTGRYVYLHMMVPHPPYSFDSNCVYLEPDQHDIRPTEQFACATQVMETIIQTLRDIDRFDDSLVIFHADHGFANAQLLSEWDASYSGINGEFDRNIDDISAAPSGFIEGFASTLFLVHRPGQASFEVSDWQVQLLDIAPTILDFFGLPSVGIGTSLLASAPLEGRAAVYYEGTSGLLPEEKALARYNRDNGEWKFSGWSIMAPIDP